MHLPSHAAKLSRIFAALHARIVAAEPDPERSKYLEELGKPAGALRPEADQRMRVYMLLALESLERRVAELETKK